MVKIDELYVFVIKTAEGERIMVFPDHNQIVVPLVYLSLDGIVGDTIRKKVMEMVQEHNLFCELRHFKLVPFSEESFYPNQPEHSA